MKFSVTFVQLEMEAIAHSKIGELYDKVLKQKDKARLNFKRSIILANSMSPRNFAMDGKLCFYLSQFYLSQLFLLSWS